ncbi:MAG: NAD(+)/NADH kinase [Desulfobacteraceae bacterium]|nr:NAD(+)/NADH kinase [Desulfobacteraceae bacterium]
MQIRSITIVLKRGSEAPQRLAGELCSWLAAKSIRVAVDEITADTDILIILGGDGTLLHVAEEASRFGIPVVGVNLGGLGFLTEVAEEECYETLEAILAGAVNIEERMMLRGRIEAGGKRSGWRYVLNDIVVSRGSLDRIVQLSAWADGEYITTYRADGLIFSTPTGSTAYNLSAGGPIVQPGLPSILVTPICPFMLESRPVLLPPSVRLRTRLADGVANEVKVIVDGQPAWDLRPGDMLEVTASDRPLRLISSLRKGYFEILRNKLNWGGCSGGQPLSGSR